MNIAATIGDNAEVKSEVRARLEKDYALQVETVQKLAAEANTMPATVESDETAGTVSDFVKTVRDAAKRIEALRVAEKAPYLAAERDVDAFFKATLGDRLDKIAKALETRVGDFLVRKEAEERRLRIEEERRLREEAARLAREAAEADRKAREAEAEAARQAEAEKALNEPSWVRDWAEEVEVESEADEAARRAAANAEAKAIEAERAQALRVEATRAATAKPADLARTRSGSGGSLATLAREWVGEVTDFDALPLEALRPYIAREALEKAVGLYVKAGGRKLAGARIYERPKTMIR